MGARPASPQLHLYELRLADSQSELQNSGIKACTVVQSGAVLDLPCAASQQWLQAIDRRREEHDVPSGQFSLKLNQLSYIPADSHPSAVQTVPRLQCRVRRGLTDADRLANPPLNGLQDRSMFISPTNQKL